MADTSNTKLNKNNQVLEVGFKRIMGRFQTVEVNKCVISVWTNLHFYHFILYKGLQTGQLACIKHNGIMYSRFHFGQVCLITVSEYIVNHRLQLG